MTKINKGEWSPRSPSGVTPPGGPGVLRAARSQVSAWVTGHDTPA